MATQLGYALAAPIRRITVDDYYRIGDAGVFADGEHVELLDGMLIAMAPIRHRHGYAARTVANLLGYALGPSAIIETNAPLALTVDSEPQPDVLVLRPPLTRYRERLPVPADVLLLIEIAETSRAYDRGPKARSYAAAGVEELWVVDLVEEEVVVLREPQARGYKSRTVVRRGDSITPARFPAIAIAVSDFLQPAAPRP
jgi:Uma2 family endonuclease